nr:helix-turn-helix domain-containing protein [uncultured Draconibacterium sp.]
MSIVYIISSVQAFIFAFLTFNKKEKCIADKVFVVLMFFLALHLTVAYFFLSNSVKSSQYLLLDAGAMVFYPALVFLYVQTLVTNAKALTLKHVIHLLPIAVLYALLLPIRHDIIQGGLVKDNAQPVFLYLVLLWGLVCNVYYISRIFILLKRHQLNIKNNFSFSERIDLEWVRCLIVGYIFVFIATLLLSVFFNTKQIDIVSSNQVIYYLLCVFVFFVGYNGYKQGAFLSVRRTNSINSPKAIPKEKSQNEIFISRLQQFMLEKKPFLNPTLTLNQLAQDLDVPPYYLSQILNSELNYNFFDFVNNFRVEEFKKNLELKSNYNYTLLAIALDSGFNSKASFNRIFKNRTGITPSQYQKSIK